MSKSTWTGAVSSDWNDADNWSPAGIPGVNSDVVIAAGEAIASASIGTVNSITDSSDLRFRSAGTNTVSTFLDNSGELRVDRKGGAGGMILNIGGTLTNSGSLRVGNATLSAPDEVTAAALDNPGEIRLLGSATNQALLDVTDGAGFGTAGVLSGDVFLSDDSAIEFSNGQINALAAGSVLFLGGNSFIEDSNALGENSALSGLSSIGDLADLYLLNGASISTTGSLTDEGKIRLQGLRGGSNLTVAGTLTIDDGLVIDDTHGASSEAVTAASFVNNGGVSLAGNEVGGAALASLNVSGPTTKNGSISISRGAGEFAGTVDGTGLFSIYTANLQFDTSVSAGQSISETGGANGAGASALTLKQAQNFAGTIYGFGTGDTIDAANFLLSGTTFNFVENSGGTGGTLTLQDGSLTANILMKGLYSNLDFTLTPDGGTGTLVKFV
jgi:hypothetical protein